jgi:hypothetical protein
MTNATNYLPGTGQWAGIAKEATPGTPMAAPNLWVPVDSPKFSRKTTPLKDQLIRGTQNKTYGQVQGMSYTEFGYKTYVYGDTAFSHFLAILGVADPVKALASPVVTPGAPATGGTFAAGTYYWVVTAVDNVGSESVPSAEKSATVTANQQVPLSWPSITGAVKYNVYRGNTAGGENVLVASPTGTSYTDTGTAGTAATPPTGGAFNHSTSVLNTIDGTHNAQPPTFTGFLSQSDGTVRQIPGMVAQSLKFTLKANEDPTLDVAWIGGNSLSIPAPTNTPSTVQNMPPFTGTVLLGGQSWSKYTGVAINIARDVKPAPVLNGTQNPGTIWGGPITVTGTLDAIYQGSADNDLANFINNVQPALSVSLSGQGDSTHPLTLQMSQVAYDSADPAPSMTDWLTIQSNIEAIANATDALDGKLSEIQVMIKNTSSTAF